MVDFFKHSIRSQIIYFSKNKRRELSHERVLLVNRIIDLSLKGLGHAILGNFSTDRMVIELTKISKYLFKTIEEL